ncbi:MAG: transcription termination/antitermination protein NusG, partial [Anaerotruncus massiliensis (ex Togo et al. 2019)]
YVLVKMIMTDDSWYVVRNIRGVTGFVGPGSKPVPLTEEEVNALGVDRKEIEVNYGVGDSVRIIDGYLDGFIGVVDEIDTDRGTLKVTVSMFGRETPVEPVWSGRRAGLTFVGLSGPPDKRETCFSPVVN